MRAVQIRTLDGPSAVEVVDVPEPTPGPDDVLVDVHMAGVTFPEVLQSRGEYQVKPELPFVPGSEVAGVVRTAPDGGRFRAGDRVIAFPGLGGFAEAVVANPVMTFPLPDGVGFDKAAALPMNYLTMHFGLARRGRLQPGESVLVHGAAGGIGTAAIQLAKAMGAGRVLGVTSTQEKADVARKAGADDVVLAEGFKDAVKELTGGKGVDVVVDPVGGDRFTDSLRCLNREGRLLVIGFTEGSIPTVKVNRLLLNNVSVVGVGWGAFFLADLGYLQEQWAAVRPMLESGQLDPVIGATFPLEQASAALLEIDERRALGKVLLQVR
ncbi:MAG TPA: NADPH:quinone oxidoreductase family protein [Mycobacteriales bacterium]|nr:NADPH:quinone oxidoreductase family protein [Mycobacteriales bacterium]